MRYLAWTNNQAKDATISSSGAASGFPASNLANFYVPEAWHSTGTATSYVEFNLGSAKTIDIFGLIGHNLTSGATITIKRGASANPTTESDVMTWREFDAYLKLAATESYQYVRFQIADASNGDGYHSFGVPWIGSQTQTQIHFAPEMTWPEVFINREVRSDVGVLHSEALARQHRAKITLSGLTRAEQKTDFDGIVRDSKGSANPLLIVPDDLNGDVYQMRAVAYDFSRRDQYGVIPLDLVEDIRGVVVGA